MGSIGTVLAFAAVAYQITTDKVQARQKTKRAQASAISSWLVGAEDSPKPAVRIMNNSPLPIYGAIVSVVAIQGAFPFDGRESPLRSTKLSIVPPGEYEAPIDFGGGAMGVRFSTELCFKDASGNMWLRDGRGKLRELKQNPLEYYKIELPVDWQSPRPIKVDKQIK